MDYFALFCSAFLGVAFGFHMTRKHVIPFLAERKAWKEAQEASRQALAGWQ